MIEQLKKSMKELEIFAKQELKILNRGFMALHPSNKMTILKEKLKASNLAILQGSKKEIKRADLKQLSKYQDNVQILFFNCLKLSFQEE